MFLGGESGDDLDSNLRPELVLITSRSTQRLKKVVAVEGDIYLLPGFHILGQFHLTHAPRTDGLPERPLAGWRGDGGATPRLCGRSLGGLGTGRILRSFGSAIRGGGARRIHALSLASLC